MTRTYGTAIEALFDKDLVGHLPDLEFVLEWLDAHAAGDHVVPH